MFFRWGHSLALLTFCILVGSGSAFAENTVTTCDTTGKKVVCTVSDSTGYVIEIHRFKNGEKSGSWEIFNKKGELIEREYYKNGIKKWTFFYRNDELIKSINNTTGKIRNYSGCGCS